MWGAITRGRSLRRFPLRSGTARRLPVPPSSYFHSKPRDSAESLGAAAKAPDTEAAASSVVAPRRRVTIADIRERRARAGRLVAPTAAYSDADMFKGPVRQP